MFIASLCSSESDSVWSSFIASVYTRCSGRVAGHVTRICSKTLSTKAGLLSRTVVENATSSCKTLFRIKGSCFCQWLISIEDIRQDYVLQSSCRVGCCTRTRDDPQWQHAPAPMAGQSSRQCRVSSTLTDCSCCEPSSALILLFHFATPFKAASMTVACASTSRTGRDDLL